VEDVVPRVEQQPLQAQPVRHRRPHQAPRARPHHAVRSRPLLRRRRSGGVGAGGEGGLVGGGVVRQRGQQGPDAGGDGGGDCRLVLRRERPELRVRCRPDEPA
jgi:hypothetical protein